MKKLITATTENDEKVYGKLVGVYELVVDVSGPYCPGWVPDCEYYDWDYMETIDGIRLAVDISTDGRLIASKPDDDYRFYKSTGIVARREYGSRRTKRGHRSNSSNKKAERARNVNRELDIIFG